MTYDPIDTNDDGTVNADVDNDSVNTEQASINGPLDAESATVEEAEIEQFGNFSASHVIFVDSGIVTAISRTGGVVAGGPESIDVSDNTDVGEILESVINSGSNRTVAVSPGLYEFKSQATITSAFAMFGAGKNRCRFIADSSLSDSDVMVIDNAGNIIRIDSIKMWEGDGGTEPDRWIRTTPGSNEILLTDNEFRGATVWQVDINSSQSPNYFTNNWFIEGGGGLRVDDASQLVILGNEFRKSRLEITNCERVVRRANRGVVTDNATGTTYSKDGVVWGDADTKFSSAATPPANTPTEIFDNNGREAVLMVFGRDGSDQFLDRVVTAADVISDDVEIERNTPPTRSYTLDGFAVNIDVGAELDDFRVGLLW